MKSKGNTLKTIWFFLKPYKIYFIGLLILCITIGILEAINVAVLYPILTYSLDLQSAQSTNLIFNVINNLAKIIPVGDPLIANCILFIILAVLSLILGIMYVNFSLAITSRIVIDNKQKLFDKYGNSDYQFFIDNKQGDLFYKNTIAPSAIARLLTLLTKFFVEIIMSISIFILLLSISLTGTVLITILAIGYYFFNKRLSLTVSYITGREKLKANIKETGIVTEYLSGIKQIKVFETFPYWRTQFNKAINKYWQMYRKGNFWLQTPPLMLNMLMFSSIAIVIILMKLQYPHEFISMVPLFGTFIFAALKLLPKLSNFGNYRMQIMDNLPNAQVVSNTLNEKEYNKIKNGTEEFSKLNTGIEFKDVTFAYKNRGTVLNNISLKINKSEMTAIVGASGSGKSTMVDLLLRLYDVDSGEICIDGTDIREYNSSSILKNVGYVSQETFIHNASIKDNIIFGTTYTEQEMIAAAELANAHEFIQQFPEKYDTVVGDRGIRLSGGEKQRIAIARAMIRKPEILILDEATSSLDNVSEKIVQTAIDKVSKNCTTLIIAHRLSTIRNADIIYVLNDGEIVESDTHEQLINKKGQFWKLYNILNE